MKLTGLLCLLLGYGLPHFVRAGIVPIGLTCELQKDPMGIDVSQPTFAYQLQSTNAPVRGIHQRAYQILVSSTPDFNQGGDVWDSRKVPTDQMAYIRYGGKPLLSSQKYWWKVRVWDQHNNPSAWSQPAYWIMGRLETGDWQAQWISAAGAEKYALSPVGYKSALTASPQAPNWVQVDLGRSQPFSEVLLYPTFYADRAGYGFPLRLQVATSDEPSFINSRIVADCTSADLKNPRFVPLHLNTPAATGRYVRIIVTKLAKIGEKYGFTLRQIEVRSGGKNIAAGQPVEAADSDEQQGFTKANLTDRVADYSTFPNYSSVRFRKDVSVKPALIRAVIHVSGLSAYELTVNGKKIGNYLLTPGWTDYTKTVLYDTYDITRQLKAGPNTLGILTGNSVYNIQPDTLRYVKFITTFGPAKAIAQLQLTYADGSVEVVRTDKTWQVAPGPITYSNLYGGEDYDANRAELGWANPGGDSPGFAAKTPWVSAIETAGPGGTLRGLSGAAPPIVAIDSIAPVRVTKLNDSLWIYDFGQNAAMMPRLTVTGPRGSAVRLIPSELLGNDGRVDRRSATQDGVRPAWWQYTLSGRSQESWFPKFFYQGARYLQVELRPATTGGELPKIGQLTDVIVHSSAAPVGRFETANPLFNQIYTLVRWAQRSNMMSFMTDCPQREKMGWLEENQLNGPSLRYNFDLARLFRKTMNDMADAQLPNGFVPNIAPEYFIAGPSDLSNPFRNSVEWGSSFIIVPWQQYLFSGDISLLERYYDRMTRYVDFLSSQAKNNIIQTGLGDWYDIGPREPWGSQLTPVAFTGTAIYYYDNWIMGQIAQTLGKQADAERFRKAAEAIRVAFNREFYKPETGLYATGSQTCSAMPLFFGLVEPQNRPKLLNALVTDIQQRNNSFTSGEVGYRFLLRALADEGRSDVIYAMNNQSDKPGYGYQIKMGATSLTEKWDAGVGSFGSQNHFMSGQINEWFFSGLAGINPDETGVGFRKIIIKPTLVDGLNWVKGSFASISGPVVSEWQRTANQVNLTVSIPPNTTATVYVPTDKATSVTESGKPVAHANGIQFIRQEKGYVVCRIGSGTYQFRATR